jgi:penicillin-binding protein 2
MLANDLGVDTMAQHLEPFGFGQITGIDLEGEMRGVLPSTAWKARSYRKPEQQRWYAGETISLGIGQGYNSFTILQMAQAITTLAGGGERHRPHLVREVVDVVSGNKTAIAAEKVEPVPIKPEHMAFIRHALIGVTLEGTSASSFRGAPYQSAGKTGTAQVVALKENEKYNAAKIAEHLRDHALYIAFAPADAPTIALAMVVENGGFGAQSAAPIARRVFDYALLGLVPSAEDIALTQQGKSAAPVGKQRPADEYPLPGVASVAPVGEQRVAKEGSR